MTRHIDVSGWIKSPHQRISIKWECDGASVSTECEAWRGQFAIEELERAGYVVLTVEAAE